MLLGYLLRQGYKYCLAKSEIQGNEISVMLMPTKRKPVHSLMHQNYDCYYPITAEPFQMMSGVANADRPVNVQLSKQELKGYQNSLQLH